MTTKISIDDVKKHISEASSKSALAESLGVTKQYLEYFLKSKGIRIDSRLYFRIKEKPRG